MSSVARTPSPRTVAVVGMGLAAPGVDGPQSFWQVLHSPTNMFREPGHFDVAPWFDADRSAPDKTYVRAAGFLHTLAPHPRLEAEEALGYWEGGDLTVRLLRHSLLQAMDTVAVRPHDSFGAYVGAQPGGLATEDAILLAASGDLGRSPACEGLRARYRHAPERASDAFCDRMLHAACRDLLPDGSDLLVVDTACSSSLYAIDFGVKALLADERDVVFAGGAITGARRDMVLFSKLQGLAGHGEIRAFDAGADGVLFADAAAVVALKTLDRAQADGDEILGLLGGFGASTDGEGSFTAPSPTGQRLALERAHAVGAGDPATVDWVVAHGTGTRLGDEIELETLAEAAGSHRLWCTSNKPLIGHGGWAAGAINVIHALLAMRHGEIPPERFFSAMPDQVRAGSVTVPVEPVAWPARANRPRVAGICAYGFGGTNAHLLVQAPDPGFDPPASAKLETGDDPMVLTGCAVHFPGVSTVEEIHGWLSGATDAPPRSFGEQYPLPPFAQLRMPPVTARSIDRTQLMALAVAHTFVTEHGEPWDGMRDRTGVFTGHTGPTRCMADYTVRVAADDLRAAPGSTPEDIRRIEDQLAKLAEQLPASNDNSMPGVLTNLIGSVVTNRYRLHGMAMNLDCGRSSTQAALHAAERYLTSGELDLALVIGLNGHSTPLMADLSGAPAGELAEGAVLFVLTRRSIAERHGWAVRALIRTDAARSGPHTGIPGAAGRRYFGADGALAVLRAVRSGRAEPIVVRNLDHAPRVEIEPVRTDSVLPARSEVVLRRSDVVPESSQAIPIKRGTLILTHSVELARQLEPIARASFSQVLCTDPATMDSGNAEPAEVADTAMLSGLDHVLVVMSARTLDPAWPAPPPASLVSLQECLLAAIAALGEDPGPRHAVTALLLDPLRRGNVHPYSTLITGFLRSLAHELPGPVYAVVTDATLEAGLEQIGAEPAAVRDRTIVLYRQGLRYVEQLRAAPLPVHRDTAPLPWETRQDRPVIVATGGARGATAAVVSALAARGRPSIWLLGTTPAEAPDDVLSAEDSDLAALRARFIARERTRDPATPFVTLVARFDAMLRAREIHRTLRELERLCGPGNVHYLVCEVRDREQVERAAKTVYAQEDHVDLLIHGAGRVRSADVANKSRADFREIRDIKVAGYHHLKTAFADPAPALWCNFGSATAVLGMPGDTDYGAASEYLCAAARYGEGAEFTVAWGVWTETGMATDVAARLTRDYGFAGITSDQGAAALLSELAEPRPLDPVVCYDIAEVWPRDTEPAGPLLGEPEADGTWAWRPDPVRDSYLAEHLIDRRPVLPAVMMLAMAAEAALRLHPGTRITGFADLRIEAPLYTDVRAAGCRVTTETVAPRTIRVDVRSDVIAPDGRALVTDRLYCRVDVHVGEFAAPPPVPPIPDRPSAEDDPAMRPDASAQLSGVWRTLHQPAGDATGASACCRPRPEPHSIFGRLPFPALLLDSALRLIGLAWPDGKHPAMGVPTALERIDFYTNETDVALAERYPEGVTLTYDAAQRHAVAADGSRTLLSYTGLTFHTVNSLPHEIPYEEWRP